MEKQYFDKTVQQTLTEMQSAPEGLTAQEAARRLEQYGPNQLEEGKKKSLLVYLLNKFNLLASQ